MPFTFNGGKCNFIVFRQSIKFKIFAYERKMRIYLACDQKTVLPLFK